jgi:hypothetical protein
MKRTIEILSFLVAIVACNKETPVKDGAIDASKIVFNIDVLNADVQATKGIKTAWEDGDDVYVFFEDNTAKYVKMTYDGSSWTYNVMGSGTLSLAASGKKLSAVYMPDFVCSAAPTYDSGNARWTFGSVGGYFQKAEAVSYTVTSTGDVNTLSATISLTAPANIMQFYVPKDAVTAPEAGNEYVLTATHVINYIFNGIVPGGAASQGNISKGFPMTANYGTVGGDEGYYFWGILEGTGTYTYDFQLVKRNAEKKYAISSYSASKDPGVEISSAAFKLSTFTDNGNFVSLGYAGGPLWATGNIDKTNGKIVDPLEAGEYFRYGKTTPYSSSESNYTGMEDPLSTSADVAYSVNTSWRIPTTAQLEALINASNTTTAWKTGWTSLGSEKAGRLITSNVNGISLFIAAAGSYFKESFFEQAGFYGEYWSSTPFNSDRVSDLKFTTGYINVSFTFPYLGLSVRPVQN